MCHCKITGSRPSENALQLGQLAQAFLGGQGNSKVIVVVITLLNIYHYTNLTFVCLSVCPYAGGQHKPFDLS